MRTYSLIPFNKGQFTLCIKSTTLGQRLPNVPKSLIDYILSGINNAIIFLNAVAAFVVA